MSSKQLAHAAKAGRLLTFVFPDDLIHGYLVGMDDYHWMVAEIHETDELVEIHLIHKGSVPRIRIARTPSLPSEPAAVRQQVEDLGRGFLAWCEEQNLIGKTPVSQTT